MSPSPSPRPAPRRLVPLLSLLLLATACASSETTAGSDSPTASATGSPTDSQAATAVGWPVTVSGDNGEVTLDEQPGTIVSMSATATEMLFAIGAGDQVEAVDSTSNYPPDAPVTDLSAFTPNAEAIAAYEPDLVVLSDDINGIVDALGTLSVPTLQLGAAANLTDSYEQLQVLGEATGHPDEAADVATDMRDRIQAAVDAAPEAASGMRVYHELDPSLFSATSATFIGSVYELFGLENVADGAADAAGGYPQLSAEYVVGEEPDLIVLADTVCCDQNAETVAERPAFDTVPAVKDERILAADDDIASRWGPRIADFAEQVSETLQK